MRPYHSSFVPVTRAVGGMGRRISFPVDCQLRWLGPAWLAHSSSLFEIPRMQVSVQRYGVRLTRAI